MAENYEKIEDVEIDLDEFLPMADDIINSEEKQTKKTDFFSKEPEIDLNDDKDEEEDEDVKEKKEDKDDDADDKEKKEKKEDDVDLDDILKDESENEDDEEESKPGRKKVAKDGLVKVFKELIEDETIIPFEDDKDISEYTMKDWKELIKANFEEKEKEIAEKTPKEFFEALPHELQYAAKYILEGGTDLKGLFKTLGKTEEIKSLDPSNESHQEDIVRSYLYATNFGDEGLIEEQVEEWTELGVLAKKANQFKPKLDKMQDQIIQKKVADQEKVKESQQKRKKEFMDNVYNTLKDGELNGVKLDNKTQAMLYNELTEVKYKSMSGKPTNKLGKLLEDYQFGEKPRYDLISEALWLLSDPDGYKDKIKAVAKSDEAEVIARKLKTEQSKKKASTTVEDEDEGKTKRKIKKQVNIFKRN